MNSSAHSIDSRFSNQTYKYDAANRLIGSNGSMSQEYSTALPYGYQSSYKYTLAGRLQNKYVKSDRLSTSQGPHHVAYDNTYSYTHPDNPYAVTHIQDAYGAHYDFDWDANGNLTDSRAYATHTDRRLCWTEDNRLQGFMETGDEGGIAAYYNYTADGERNIKLTSPRLNMHQNASLFNHPPLVIPTLYASPLITLTPKGYTKHYFEEGRRVCNKLGGWFLWRVPADDILKPVEEVKDNYEEQHNQQQIWNLLHRCYIEFFEYPMRECFDDRYSVLNYTYNQNGYITHKGDSKTGQYEDYVYDALGRLTQYTVNNSVSYSFEYDGSGNITRNTKVSPYYYNYNASQPNAVSGIEANPGMVSSAQCDGTSASGTRGEALCVAAPSRFRKKIESISQDGWTLQLAYGDGLQRESEVLTHNSTAVSTTNFVSDDCEHEIRPGGSRYLDYIRADGRIVAIHVKNGTTDSIYYVQTDLLGSWERIVDNNRNVVQSSHFDPWGNRMSAADWTAGQDGTSFSFRRGFTGHEHYDRFRIINMNARLYDPVIGRFFSPDPQVQSPFSTQGLNRYTYCGNNPVMYIDEDGEFAWIIPVISGLVNLGVNIVNGNIKGDNLLNTIGRGAIAFFAGAAQGAGACLGPEWNALGGAIANGANTWLNGGSFISGAVTGSITSTIGYLTGQWASNLGNVLINGFNVTSPVLKGIVGGGVGGGLSGFISNFIASCISNEWNIQQAYRSGVQGFYYGSLMGSVSGGAVGYKYASNHNINPWTGKPKGQGIVIGRDMKTRVNPTAEILNMETISNDWNASSRNNFNNDILVGKQFNRDWFQIKIEEGYAIFDIGKGNNPIGVNYGMELRYLQGYDNVYPTTIIFIYKKVSIIHFYGPTTY